MKKTIIDEYQLDHLVDIGVLYKTRDGTYHNLIDHKVWGYVNMPQNMVDDVAGKTVDVKVDKDSDDEADRWVTDDGQAWYIQPWMLVEYYDRLKQWGKYRPIPSEEGDDPDIDKYTLHIMSRTHLENLVEQGIVTKETLGDGYVYRPVITDMGGVTMPDIMAEQMCGKTFDCDGTGTTWAENETEHRWSVAQWMLDRNYAYLLSRKKGILDPEGYEDEEEEEEEEEDEEEHEDWCETTVVGTIIETNPEYITVDCSAMSVPVLCYGNAESYNIDEHVRVRGNLRRIHNMMGYPEIEISYIEED